MLQIGSCTSPYSAIGNADIDISCEVNANEKIYTSFVNKIGLNKYIRHKYVTMNFIHN